MSDSDFSYADDEELVSQFVSWTSEAVAEMRQITDSLEPCSEGKSSEADRLYDLSHNIKGMGASFNFQLMTEAGTSLCGYIKKLDGKLSARVIDAHVRTFEVVLSNKITGDGGDKGKALVARLAAIVSEES